MIRITHKSSTFRLAVAAATVKVSSSGTIAAIQEQRIPKGDVLGCARVAGLFAVKNTASVIPDCHPLPVEFTEIRYHIESNEIHIEVEVHSIYKTGVEVEAMHGAAIVALTMYDMLKPVDKGVEIQNIRLLTKKGGKSSFADYGQRNLEAAVIVCSDTIAAGKKEDKAGNSILEKLRQCEVNNLLYEVVPDEIEVIRARTTALCNQKIDLIVFCGGTGLSPRDVTPEAIRPLLDQEIPGIMEAARNYGQQRTPYAMLSRGVAGRIGQTLLLTVPGSLGGARETMDALFPWILHVFFVMKGERHEKNN